MTNDAHAFMNGYLQGRYPNNKYKWDIVMTRKRDPKDRNSSNQYILIIIDESNTAINQSKEFPFNTKNSICYKDINEMINTLKV